jgi:hypothetical protein
MQQDGQPKPEAPTTVREIADLAREVQALKERLRDIKRQNRAQARAQKRR